MNKKRDFKKANAMKQRKNLTVKPYQLKKLEAQSNGLLNNDALSDDKKPVANTIGALIILAVAIAIILLTQLPMSGAEPKPLNAQEFENTDEQSIAVEPLEKSEPPKYLKKYIRQNADTVGYIKIDDTMIDYPVVQTDNNDFYIGHGFSTHEDHAGAIFMDYRCDVDALSKTRNIILYGHRMKDGSMFKGLLQYQDKDFFLAHQTIQFDTLNETLRWKVFAVFETTTDFYYIDTEFPYDEMWLSFLDECHQLSLYKTYMNFYSDDIILTLSTCTVEENGRFVVMAKLIR